MFSQTIQYTLNLNQLLSARTLGGIRIQPVTESQGTHLGEEVLVAACGVVKAFDQQGLELLRYEA